MLLVPGFAAAWRRASASRPLRLPALARMARRGAVSREARPPTAWRPQHLHLLALLGLEADAGHAGAPLAWLGLGGDARQGGWLQAEFVHLEVGSQTARLHAVSEIAAEEAVRLAATLQSGLEFPGITVRSSPDPQRFAGVFLHSGDPFDVVCPVPGFEEQVELRDVLPQGRDGPTLRRLLTEAQMLLHDHPVNADRERRKLRSANAVWLSGPGEFAGILPSSFADLAGDGAYLKGLCRLHGGTALSVPRAAESVLPGRLPALVELPPLDESDPVAALNQLEHDWVAPLERAIRAGRVPGIVLQLDDLSLRVDRSALRRFWRRGPGFAELLQ